MSVANNEPTAWVGVVGDGAGVFVRLSRAGASEPRLLLDLPTRLHFRIPMSAVNAAGDFAAQIEGVGWLTISAELDGGQVHGSLDLAGRSAPFVLERLASFDAAFAAAVGSYESVGRTLLLCLRGDQAARIPFYAEGDAIVRLYPLGPKRYLSERCEEVTLEGAGTGSLIIRRVGEEEHRLARFDPYEVRPFAFGSPGAVLSGTLLLPHGASRCGAVVLMHGSQPGERDFYRVYADRFARAGLAALIFDKRGFGLSEGSPKSSLQDRAEDAAAAVRHLRQLPEIDTRKIGLWAFSNGTWSAPMVAAGMEEVAFLVAVGAAGVSPAAAETYRKLAELREWAVPDALVVAAAHGWTLAYAVVTGAPASDGWETEFEEVIERLHAASEIASIPLADYARANPWLAPIPPRLPAAELRALSGAFPEMAHDPVADYGRVRCPVLFLVGSDDPNVPGSEGASRVRAALEAAGHREHAVAVMDGAAHFMNLTGGPVRGMSLAEASGELHNFNFVPGYLDRVTNWIVARTA